jgi:ATP-dependent DNA helicase RecG
MEPWFFTIPKNPLIARSFFWVKYAEEVGTGTNKIVKWCKEWKLPEPDFEEIGTSFVVTFQSKYKVDDLHPIKLNERQQKAIEYLENNTYITNTKYREINDISKALASEELSFMVKQLIINKIGNGRSTKYILVND